MRRALTTGIVATALALAPAVAAGQDTPRTPGKCTTYRGITCQGWFTDEAGVVDDDERVENAIDAVVAEYDNEIAMVIVPDSGGADPLEFAIGLANTWEVGDPNRNDGIVVLIDLEARRTEVTTGPGVSLPESSVAGAGNSFFGRGDFEGGVLAILGSLEQALAAFHGGGSVPAAKPTDDDDPRAWAVIASVGVVGAAGVAIGLRRSRQRRRRKVRRRRREDLIDDVLESLKSTGDELPQPTDYADPFTGTAPSVSTSAALGALRSLGEPGAPLETEALTASWAGALIMVTDRDRILAETEVPLVLRASAESPLLEEATQKAARAALDASLDDELFELRRRDLIRLVTSLRPHRVAAARSRVGVSLADSLVPTPVGDAALTDKGQRFLRAGPALDSETPLALSLAELLEVSSVARDKTARLETLYAQLPAVTSRPAVAAALADLDDSVESSLVEYERVRAHLEEAGDVLDRDGLSIPAIAALLLMNNDEGEVDEFLEAYRADRAHGLEPDEAVEYALAGLQHHSTIERVRKQSRRLGLPISITAALLRRRDDGPAVYNELVEELAEHDLAGESRRTVAGILAIALEPAHAVRRWAEARAALTGLGLEGAYADVAAAFGASDPRGPRVFALAYAAQREELARSSVEGADRFAPELAHDGTSRRKDSWTGEPIPTGLYHFDPYTLLFYHWIITKGHRGTYGWEPIYRDQSWARDRGSWWGGFGGGGGFSGGGGSSWGGGSWGGGGFGGFGGGGGSGW